ncbi:hypothetical protein [Mangrovibacterium lignilyticum]|nr:hypothetical protein [Mangrovibacterium lignilyticum]
MRRYLLKAKAKLRQFLDLVKTIRLHRKDMALDWIIRNLESENE